MHRFLPKVTTLVLGLVCLLNNSSFAQIKVSLPTKYYSNSEVTLPVSVQDVSQETIYAFLFSLNYDSSIFEITGVEAGGDIAEDFAFVLNTTTPGVATITGAHFEPLEGEGILFRIVGRFVNDGTTDLVFDSFVFNEGDPVATTENGQISNTIQISTEDENVLPESFDLKGNYPNPFNPTTSIEFDLPEAADVTINVVDMLGRVVMNIPGQQFQAGRSHQIQLDASSIASGVYVYQVIAQGSQATYTESATMTLIK